MSIGFAGSPVDLAPDPVSYNALAHDILRVSQVAMESTNPVSTMSETLLEMVRRHARNAERIIAGQENPVKRLRRNGYDTETAEKLLLTYREMLLQMQLHLACEERNGGR